MQLISGVATSALSRGRQPTDSGHHESLSREAAVAKKCCRRFAATAVDDHLVCGLTPAAKCCHRFAVARNDRLHATTRFHCRPNA